MQYSNHKRRIDRVWIDAEGVYAITENGMQAGYRFDR